MSLATLSDEYSQLSTDGFCIKNDTNAYSVSFGDFNETGWLKIIGNIGASIQESEKIIELNLYNISSFDKEMYNINGSLFFDGSCKNSNEEKLTDFISVVNIDFNGETESSIILDEYGFKIGVMSSQLDAGILKTTLYFNDVTSNEEFYIENNYNDNAFELREFEVMSEAMNCSGYIYSRY